MAPPVLEPTPPSLARQHYRGRIIARRKAIRALRFVAFFALIAFAILGLYLGKRGFGQQWRHRITEELRKRGIRAEISRLTLDPFRGLVAQDVRIFDFSSGDNVLGAISEISVDINYAALMHHQPFINALDVRDARVTIPLPPRAGMPDRARITNFRAHVLFPPDQIYVSEAEGDLDGVRILASGQLIKISAYRPPAATNGDEWRNRLELLQRIVGEIAHCSFPQQAPSVQLKFSADLSDPAGARGTAVFRADRIARGAYSIDNVQSIAEWAQQKLTVSQCEWHDNAGNFSARGTWNSGDGIAEFQIRSSTNLRQFLGAIGFGKIVSDFAFTTPPLVEISGSARPGKPAPQMSVIGRISASNFACKSVGFAEGATEFAWDGTRTMLRNVRLRHESGELTADLLDAPGDFRFNIESTLNPAAISAVFPGEAAQVIREWQWQRSPHLRLSVRGATRSPESWTGDGMAECGQARFRGVAMKSMTTRLRFADKAIHFDDFRITRDEGTGTGSCAYDFAQHEVRLANVKTTLRPTDAIVWIEPKLFKEVAPYKFHNIPSVTANGVVQFHRGTGDHLELLIDAPTGMEYVFLGKTLPIDKVAGRLLFTNDRLQISDLAGTLFGGVVRGGADISLAKGDPHYRANLVLDSVDFPKLTDLYFKYQSARGRLAGSFDWSGFGDDARSIKGAGKLRVSEGNVFAIPIFGPLSSLLGAIIPGAGYSVAHQATADFTVDRGVIHTDDFKVSGRLFGMVGHGDVRYVEDRLDFDIKVSGSGPGLLLTPVYKLFEYKGEGSLSKPNWHPKHF